MAGRKLIDLATTEVLPAALERVPESVARREHILPLTFDGERLTVVMSEPPSSETLERLRFALNCPIAVVMAPHDAIGVAIEQYYGSIESRKMTLPSMPAAEQVEFVEIPDEPPRGGRQMLDPAGPAVVRMVQEIIGEALHLTASRVLILPVRNRLKVAYRIQDAVYTRDDAPRDMHYPILVRLMAMTNLSGLIKVHLGEKELALRAVFKPSQFGLLALIEVGGEAASPEYWQARAKRLGYPFLNLDAHKVAEPVLRLLPESVVRHHRCLPIGLDEHVLTVATSDPPEPDLLEQLRFLTNRSIEVAMAPAGALLAAIDRHYGPADSEAADVILWELAQAPEPAAAGEPGPAVRSKPTPAAKHVAKTVLDCLHAQYTDKMLKLFEQIRSGERLCGGVGENGEIEVVFPQSHLMEQMPPDARAYIENRVWALREAVIVRLESFLAANRVVRGLAMTYALYLAACGLRQGRRPALNPAGERDAWINFLYALAIRLFPAVQSNGALLSLVTEQMDQVEAKIGRLLEDASFVSDPPAVEGWLLRLTSQVPSDASLDADSPPVGHLVDLLLAEAAHVRASRVAMVPRDDRLEVGYRVQKAVYARESLPLDLLYPVLARLSAAADAAGTLRIGAGRAARDSHLTLSATPCGPAASIDLPARSGAVKASRALAARHHLEFVDLADFDAPTELLRIVPMAVLQSKLALPMEREEDGSLKVAVASPPSPRQLDALRLAFNSLVTVALAAEDDLRAALYRHRHPPTDAPPLSPAALALLGIEPPVGERGS